MFTKINKRTAPMFISDNFVMGRAEVCMAYNTTTKNTEAYGISTRRGICPPFLPSYTIREIHKDEYHLLEDFLYNAIYLPPGTELPERKIIYEPEIFVYVKDFGGKDDCGVVAEKDGEIVGAAWTRIIPAYGNIDADTPELAISILPEYRGQSIGTDLMIFLFRLLCERGYKRTSLSVQKDNPAVRFYERLGYEITDEKLDHAGHEDYIMVKQLNEMAGKTQ